jgi:calcium-dependent protein kinase
VLHQSYEGSKYDPWSCGVVCYILLSGYSPFEGATDALVMEQIIIGKVDFNDPAWDGISDEAKDFVQHLLTYEENSRPTAEQAMKHAWIQNSIKASTAAFMQDYGESSVTCFENIFDFASNASLKLKEAVYTYIASQLLRKEEREEIDRVFRGMDDDCDGRLSKADVRKGYKLFFDKELSDDETDKLFERINTSETGYIDYTEFVIAAMQKSKILDADKLKAAFSKFDRGDKGYISADDLKVTLSGVVALPTNDVNGMSADQIIEEMMKEVDVEGDGKISYQNFADMMLQSGRAGASYDGGMDMDVSDEKEGANSKQETSSTSLGGQDLNTGDSAGQGTLSMDWATASMFGHESDDWAHQSQKGVR